MEVFSVFNSDEDAWAGPYLDKALAERVLGIFQIAVDEESEISVVDCDPFAEQLRARLLPWKISVEIMGGVVKNTEISLTWPPAQEGVTLENDFQKEYFFWAASQSDAILKMAGWGRKHQVQAGVQA